MSDEFPLNKDLTYMARTNFRGQDQTFGIKRKDRRQHMYVLGKSGTGKSVLLSNMIIQNIRNGEGVCVVDPHGELVEEILHSVPPERANDVVYFNPADTDFPVGFNVFDLDDPKYKHLVASGLMGIFTKIWANAWSSRMEYILNNAILALLETPGSTLLGIPRLLVDKDYRQAIINNLKDPVIKAFWVHEYEAWREQFRNEAIAPIQNKVGQFLSASIIRNVVGQAHSTIDIFNIMNEGKIFLVNVSKGRIGEDNSSLLGGMIITKIQLSAMERVRIPEQDRKDFYLYVDEFQNFVTDSFASILSEARKYRLNLTIAHQYIGQLETASGSQVRDAVFGNVGTMITFRVGAADADFLEKEYEPEFTPEDMVNLPNYHIYLKLMVDGITSRPFSAKTLPPIQINHAAKVADQIVDASRKNYAKTREQVEADITRWAGSLPGDESRQRNAADENRAEGKFKAECSECGKTIFVPFEPKPGLPIYCKEDLLKIKNGQVIPAQGFRAPREKEDNVSYDALASMGIEFAGGKTRPTGRTGQQAQTPVIKERAPLRLHTPTTHQSTTSAPFKKTDAPRPPRPEGKSAGLASVISQALNSVIPPKPAVPVKKEEPAAMSLASLKKENAPVNEKAHTLAKPALHKDAKEGNVSLLRDAIAKAMGGAKPATPAAVSTPAVSAVETPKPAVSKEVLLDEMKKEDAVEAVHLAEEKAAAAKVLREAEEKNRLLEAEKKRAEENAKRAEEVEKKLKEVEEKNKAEKERLVREQEAVLAKEKARLAEEAERITKEKEAAYARELAEKEAKIIEDARKEAEEKKKRDDAAQPPPTYTADAKNKTREVPEDILRQILE
jgi:CxxC-x17-CxxC domain-containing protein